MTPWQPFPREPLLSAAPYDGEFYLLGDERTKDLYVVAYWDAGRATWDTLDGIGYQHDAFTHYAVIDPLMNNPQPTGETGW